MNIDQLLAKAQVSLAFFYGLIFVGMFAFMAIYWTQLSKFDVGLLTMFATGAMNQSKDAGNFFFARQRTPTQPDPTTTTTELKQVTLPSAPAPGDPNAPSPPPSSPAARPVDAGSIG